MVSGDKVYFGGGASTGDQDRHFYCLNAETGAVLWEYKADGNMNSSPCMADGRIYIGSRDGHLYCFTE